MFDSKAKKYWWYPPSDAHDWVYDIGYVDTKKMPWMGYNKSGRTVS